MNTYYQGVETSRIIFLNSSEYLAITNIYVFLLSRDSHSKKPFFVKIITPHIKQINISKKLNNELKGIHKH